MTNNYRGRMRTRLSFLSLSRSRFALARRTSWSVTKTACSKMPFTDSGMVFPVGVFPLSCRDIPLRNLRNKSFSSGVQGRPQSLQILLSRAFLYPLTSAFWQSVEHVRACLLMRCSGILLRSTMQKVWKVFISKYWSCLDAKARSFL